MSEGPLKPNEELAPVDIDAIDSRCREERRKRRSVEFCPDDDELRVGVGIAVECGCRLKAPRRGRRIFKDGVVGVVMGDFAALPGGVEAGVDGASEGGADESTETDAESFCWIADIGSFLALGRKLRDFASGCTICQRTQNTI